MPKSKDAAPDDADRDRRPEDQIFADQEARRREAEVDLDNRQVRRGRERIELTAMEWAVVSALANHPGRIYSRGEIEQRLAAEGLGEADSNSLEVIISRLRKKLGPASISTHRGLGYRLDA